MEYKEFLEAKKHSIGNYGVQASFIPEQMFDYQKYVTEYAIKKGRCAVFLDTGLGKTLIELAIAKNYIQTTNKPVLIITPLAVAFQFIKEAEKFGIDDIEYSKDGKYSKKIVICNYERLHYFNYQDFDCSLMHKLIVEDSTECFTAMPDYVLIFKKAGENEVPVTHPVGLSYYAGAVPILPEMSEKYGTFEQLTKKYSGWEDPKTNKLSHIIWQRYASSVWDDIRIDEVLEYKEPKDEDDEKHVHPLQLDVIDRIVELYSNPGEVVLTPFMGVGSEVYSPVSMGRKAIGIELKDTYYKQAIKNLLTVKTRFVNQPQLQIF